MSTPSKRHSPFLAGLRSCASGIQPGLALGAGALLALAPFACPTQGFSATAAVNAPAKPLPASPMQAPAAASSAATGTALDATDLTTLRAHLGETVEITGTPTGTGVSKAGSPLYLNFSRQKGGAVTVVFFLPKGDAAATGSAGTKPTSVDDLKQFVGKTVTVKGQLSDYKGDLQMVVPYLEQIKAQ